jgi:hypothetical protein
MTKQEPKVKTYKAGTKVWIPVQVVVNGEHVRRPEAAKVARVEADGTIIVESDDFGSFPSEEVYPTVIAAKVAIATERVRLCETSYSAADKRLKRAQADLAALKAKRS